MAGPDTNDTRNEPPAAGRPWRRAGQALLSLRGRIVLLVLAATGVTAMLAAWTSTAPIERYLGRRIEERFPALLGAKERELDAWYRQAPLNLDTFARSETLIRNVPRIGTEADAVAREELRIYLGYVQERFERFPALYLLNPEGELILRAGRDIAPPAAMRAKATGLEEPLVHEVVRLKGERLQLASAPVRNADGATLHALIHLTSMDSMLGDAVQRDATDVYVVDGRGGFVAGTLATRTDGFVHPGPDGRGDVTVATYVNGLGERVIGAARPAGRRDWTLVVGQAREAAFEPVGALVSRIVWANLAIGFVLVLVAARLALSIVRPLGALSAAAQRLAAGETDVHIDEPRGATELVRLTRAFNLMTSHLREQRRELEHRNEALQELSVPDGLTGLFNHRYFSEHLPLEIKRAERSGQPLALIVLDIDDFQSVNDRWGHAVGDRVLRAIADTLGRAVRATDVLARYGGEEFVVVSLQRDIDGAISRVHKIRRAVAAIEWPIDDDDTGPATALRATVSPGIALHAGDGEDLFRRADAALYEAKRAGRNRVAVSAPGSDTPIVVDPPSTDRR
jgi:diguanylate cyclase (GGDEF)-like protein